jgi:hypothetical protein
LIGEGREGGAETGDERLPRPSAANEDGFVKAAVWDGLPACAFPEDGPFLLGHGEPVKRLEERDPGLPLADVLEDLAELRFVS